MPQDPKRLGPRDMQFTEEQILRADDPRPQRVTQYPIAGARRMVKRAEEMIPTGIFDTEKHDQEMQAQYGKGEGSWKPAFLYVERGPGQGQLIEVKQGTLVIGRASVSELRLQHPSISRRHTQIRRVGEQFFVKDLGSQNGTFINKTRLAGESEARPGDSITLGNAMLKLRGPLAKGEKLPAPSATTPDEPSLTPIMNPKTAKSRAVTDTAVVSRGGPTPRWLKVAVFAGAAGFGLAAVLMFAVFKAMMAAKEKPAVVAHVDPRTPSSKEAEIEAAIARKMAEQKENPAPEKRTVVVDDTTVVEPDSAPAINLQRKIPGKSAASGAPTVTPVASAKQPAVGRAAVPAKPVAEDDDEDAPAAKPGNAKRIQILAAYEKGNAEGSLEAAKAAGDRDLSAKLTAFIQAYDNANDAMMANNGSSAIKNFTKAMELDDQLSNGWGKYGAEIRRQLSSLYVLVGMQYASNGDDANARKAFQAALKYDPKNERAKGQLEKLGSSGDSEPEAAAAPAKKAPAKKAAPKSIDDAFGD